MKFLLVIFFIIKSWVFIQAQQPYSVNLNKLNGLPSDAVYDILQDKKGFIWFASNAGLVRYDGKEYKIYQSAEQTSAAGSNIKEDNFGRIWYENFDGYLYFVKNDTLQSFKQNIPIGFLPFGITNKNIFVIQKNGIDIYDIKNLKIIKTIPIAIKSAEHSNSNITDFYCIIDDIIYRIDEKINLSSSRYFEGKKEILKKVFFANDQIYVISRDNEKKRICFFKKDMSFSHTIPTSAITSVQGSSFIDDKFWIHTPKGTFVFDEKNNKNKDKTLFNGHFDKYLGSYFEDKNISCVIKDRQNNYWFSTTNQGVFLVSNLQNTIYPFEGFLPNRMVAITPNKFIIGTKKGELIACNGTFDKKTVVKEKTDHSEIYYLKYDTIHNNLFYTAKHFTHLPNLNYADSRTYTLALKEITYIDANYYAFVASGYCGLVAFDSKKTAQKSVWDSFYFKGKMSDKNTAPIITDVRGKSVAYHKPNKTIYLATNIGLYLQTPKEIRELKMENKPFYAAKVVIYEDNIFTLNTKGNLYAILNERDFVSLNNVFEIKEFDILNMKQFGKYLFLFTREWLYVLDMDKNAQKLQKINININPYEINDFLIQDNLLFLLTDNGVVKTAINNTSHQNNKIVFQINEFFINDKKQELQTKKRLEYYENDLKIHFSVLDFGSSYQNKIFYRINQDNWKMIANETRTLTFAQLAVGYYEIEFKVNEEISDIKIIVDIIAPFWKTNWFLGLCFLLFIVLITIIGFLYYRFQLGKIKAKNVLLQEKNTLLKEKIDLENNLNKSILTSIKAQMNPHFFFNALNTIQAYIFTNDKAKANSYLAKFSKLTRIILEQSEKETISLNEEIQGLTLYLDLEKMRFENVFEYKIIFSEQFDNEKISKEMIEIPPMIIQPYIENAIKHGLLHQENNRKLEVFFDIEQNENTENNLKNNLENDTESYLKVIIDDNGIGRKRSLELNKIKNEKYQSFSTKANQKRLEILNNKNNKKIAVQIIDKVSNNDVVSGTKVIIIIPIKI